MSNPFVSGRPVEGVHFANRRRELVVLTQGLTGGQSFWLHSPRRIGKTSLVLEAMHRLPPSWIRLHADLFRVTDLASLCEELGSAYLRGLRRASRDLGEALRDYIPSLKSASLSLGEDYEVRLDLTPTKRDYDRVLDELLDAPDRIADRGEPVVVFIDEFQSLLSLQHPRIEALVRERVNRSRRDVVYVFAGSQQHLMAGLFEDPGRPLYQSCASLPLHPIALEEWLPFLRERFRAGGFVVPDPILTEIVRLSEGKPAYTQDLARHFFNTILFHKGEVPATLDEALEALLDSQDYVYTTIWEAASLIQRRVLVSLATEGPEDLKSAERLEEHRLSHQNLSYSLKALGERGVLERGPEGTRLADPFFGIWITRLAG